MTQSSSVHQEDRTSGGKAALCGAPGEHVGMGPGPRAADLGKEAAEPPGGLDMTLSQ